MLAALTQLGRVAAPFLTSGLASVGKKLISSIGTSAQPQKIADVGKLVMGQISESLDQMPQSLQRIDNRIDALAQRVDQAERVFGNELTSLKRRIPPATTYSTQKRIKVDDLTLQPPLGVDYTMD